MSLSARNWAWDVNRITVNGVRRPVLPGEKLTLLCLAEMENTEEGCAWPSMEHIAERTGQSVRSVQTHLKTLIAVHAVEQDRRRSTRGRWMRNVYYLNVPDSYREADPEWLRIHGG